MGTEQQQYDEENRKLRAYEAMTPKQENVSESDLGYRDMNTRFINLEKSRTRKSEWEEQRKLHVVRKRQIETLWVQKTRDKAKALESLGDKEYNRKQPEYYAAYSLEQMEILLKSSYRGGNSEVYNNVATDLELYNAVSKKSESLDPEEKRLLLTRLKQSADDYIKSRHPIFSTGRIRKAMITAVSKLAGAELAKIEPASGTAEDTTTAVVTTTATTTTTTTTSSSDIHTGTVSSQAAVLEKNIESATFADAKKAFDALSAGASEAAVCEAVKIHFSVINRFLKGELQLEPEETQLLDSQMTELMDRVETHKADADQLPCLSTRFFNALGWTSRKPVLTDNAGLMQAASVSPLKKIMYHTINPLLRRKSALPLAQQLSGKSRHYLSDGVHGKGTYMTYRSDIPKITDVNASDVSWIYGGKKGAVQVSMCFNQNARIISEEEIIKKAHEMKQILPGLHDKILETEKRFKYQRTSAYDASLSIFAALYGFNAIDITTSGYNISPYPDTSGYEVKYAVTFDRSTLTISTEAETRNSDSKYKSFVAPPSKKEKSRIKLI